MNQQADSIQGVLIIAPGQQQDEADKLWHEVFPNDPPDGYQRANTSPALSSSAFGERHGYRTTITAQVGRVDVALIRPPDMNNPQNGPNRIQDIPDAAAQLADIMKRLAIRIKAPRIAVVLDIATTLSAGSESIELRRNLPGFPFPPNSIDFNVQFNVRRPFAFSTDYEMNRVCRWATGHLGFLVTGPGQAAGLTMMSPFLGFKIDVNSAPEMSIPANKINEAIADVFEEVLLIASNGIGRFQ